MKRLLSTILLALVVTAGQAKEKTIVWEQPAIEYGTDYGDGYFHLALDVTKVELKADETVVYITATPSERPLMAHLQAIRPQRQSAGLAGGST
jgi:hypothetical protein